jgi:hypothetical protein
MKFKITFAIVFFYTMISHSQQIGSGYAPYLTDFTIPLMSGVYGGSNAIGKAPDESYAWQHLLVIRHANPDNNHQLQIASSFVTNDRLFFRKMSGYLEPQNPDWIELATRGTNNFIGNQSISENLGVGTINPSSYQHGGNNKVIEIFNPNTTSNSQSHIILSSGSTLPNSSLGSLTWTMPNITSPNKGLAYFGVITGINSTSASPSSSMIFATRNSNQSNWNPNMILSDTGNLGINTLNPDEKLTVIGKIHAQEVRIDLNFPAPDYVFANDYKLKSLKEVEEFITKNNHLPEIPSAKEIEKNGLMLAEMNMNLLKKMEEMTLYIIEMNKKLEEQNIQIQSQNIKLISLEKQIQK